MGLTLTGAAGEVPVRHRLARAHDRVIRSIAHDVLDDEYPVVTITPATSRRGTLRLQLADEAAALLADALIADGGLLTLDDPENPAENMRLIPADRATITVDPTTGLRRVLEFPFVEVAP